MKKIFASFIALVLGASAFAEFSYRFYNKTFSDTMNIRHVDKDYLGSGIDFKGTKDDSYTDTEFLGIYNRVYAEVKTDKTDAMIKATFGFNDWTDDSDYGFRWDGGIEDWYVEYRPWSFLTFGFHDAIYMDGSYLPVYDDNLYSGNIGSEGMTAVYKPAALKGALRIAATTPFTTNTNWVKADKDDTHDPDDTFDVGIGAIYTVDLFQVGATLQDIFDGDERRFGTYVNLPTLFGLCNELTVGGGFAHSEGGAVYNFDGSKTFDDYTYFGGVNGVGGVNGENLLSSYLTYNGNIVVNAELVWNMNDSDFYSFGYVDDKGNNISAGGWDFYTAASVQFWIARPLSATIIGKLVADTAHADGVKSLDNIYAAEFKLTYQLTQHSEVEASVSVDYFDKNYKVCFPCYWKYTF